METLPAFGVGEIERILNRLRLMYLQAIALSPSLRGKPAQAVSSNFNRAFHSLAGLEVHQKDSLRGDNNWFWENQGFDPRAKHDLDWGQERKELASVLQWLTRHHRDAATATYAELIALKPGFHEAWLHNDFPNDAFESPESPRGRVFAILRGNDLDLVDLKNRYPGDLRVSDKFLGYASCAVTEGPFVRRRNPDVSYFSELKEVSGIPDQAARRSILRDSFMILDSWQRLHDEDTAKALVRLIDEAEGYVGDACPGQIQPLIPAISDPGLERTSHRLLSPPPFPYLFPPNRAAGY